MAHQSVYNMIDQVARNKTKKDVIEALRRLPPAVQHLLVFAVDPSITWLIPEGTDIPYKRQPNAADLEGRLLSEIRRLYIFLKGGNPNLKQHRREQLFIELLESIDSKDADLLIAAKDKKLPWKNINLETVQEAYPNLFTN